MDLNRFVQVSALLASCLIGACASVPKHASTASGEFVHEKGASRERCIDWLIHTTSPTPEHWLQLLDELAAEPEPMRKESVKRVMPYISQWPDELRIIPAYWTAADVNTHAILLPLIKHLDYSKLGKTWRQGTLPRALPSITTLTLRTFAQTDYVVAHPNMLEGVRDVRLRLSRSEGYKKPQGPHVVAFLKSPFRERLTALDMLSTQLNHPVFDALAEVPLSLKTLRVSTRSSPKDQAFLNKFKAWLNSPHVAHLEALSVSLKPGLLARTFSEAITSGARLKRLQRLSLVYSGLKPEELLALSAWPGWIGLQSLTINSGKVTPAITKAMSLNPSLQGLRQLTLRNVNLTDEAISWLGHSTMLGSLTHLDVSRNRLTTQGMWRLLGHKQLGALEHLNAKHNQIRPGIGAYLTAAPHGQTLKSIALDSSILGASDALAMSKATWALESLSVQSARLDAMSMQVLLASPWMKSVQHLNLAHNTVSAEGIRALSQSKALLRTLNLSRTQLDDEGLRLLMDSDQVRLIERLNLYQNEWTHAGTVALSKAKNMERLMFVNLRENDLGPPERIGDVANSPTMLHMHRALISPKRLDLGEFKNLDMGNNEVTLSKGNMSLVSDMSHIPALGERVVKSAYLSTTLRRLINEALVESMQGIEKDKEKIPAAARFFMLRYISRVDDINREMSPGQTFRRYVPVKKVTPKAPATTTRQPQRPKLPKGRQRESTPKGKVYDFKDSRGEKETLL